jgi:hypothetical protein
MSFRKKKFEGRLRKITDEEDTKRFDQALSTLEDLCVIYDSGNRFIASTIASHVQKTISEGNFAIKVRGQTKFPSSPFKDNLDDELAAYFHLTSFALRGEASPPYGEFQPRYLGETQTDWEFLKFKDWWNQRVIRASGAPAGETVFNNPNIIPFNKREAMTRRTLVKALRDHLGSHHLGDYPVLFDDLDKPERWLVFELNDEKTGKLLSTSDGTLEWRTGQFAAAMRQIAFEVLAAFGRQKLTN